MYLLVDCQTFGIIGREPRHIVLECFHIQKQIYLIDNDFFEQDGSNEFKNFIKDKAIIKQLIALPNTMFQEENFTRGILVLELLNDENIHQKTGIYMLPSFTETDKLNQVLQEIKKDLK